MGIVPFRLLCATLVNRILMCIYTTFYIFPQPAVETSGKAGKVLVRRKSYLPQDYDTVQALQNYTPQDGPLSKKSSTPSS